MTYWKATRSDGRDFYTGSVDYAAALASGEPVTAPVVGPADDLTFPGPGWYHLSTTPTECVGMSWPCRLFEAEPVGDVIMDSAHPYKIGARSVRVLREIDAHRVFGPQGEQVAALIERCRVLSVTEVERLANTREADWEADWDAAWDAARGAVWDAARGAALYAAWDAVWDAAGVSAGDAAGVAARVAALALLCRDLIGQAPGWDQDAYNLLTGPWRDVIGPIHPDDPALAGALLDGDSDE